MPLPPFDATQGSITQTSYVSVEEADTLLALRWGGAPAWDAADTTQRETALMAATRLIRQALTAAGITTLSDAALWNVQNATAEFAEILLTTPGVEPAPPTGGVFASLPDVAEMDVPGTGRFKRLEGATSGAAPGATLPVSVRGWLATLLITTTVATGSVPVTRSA